MSATGRISLGASTYTAETAIGPYLRVFSTGTTAGLATADELEAGVTNRAYQQNDSLAAELLAPGGRYRIVADGAINSGADVYRANDGKVSASGSSKIGRAATTAIDGEVVEVVVESGGGGSGSVEGTAVLSTGEPINRVLTADGDNTSSWQPVAGGGSTLDSLLDTDITAVGDGEVLVWSTADWINQTLTEAGIAAAVHNHDHNTLTNYVANEHIDWTTDQGATNIDVGNITASAVTQHEGSITHDNLSGFVANEHLDWTSDLGATNVNDANITPTAVTQHEASINHNNLSGYVANEHLDWTADLGATNVNVANITAAAVTQHEASIDHDALTNFVANEHIDWTLASQGTIHATNYAGGSSTLDSLTDTTITSPSTNEVLTYNGSVWVNQAQAGGGDVTAATQANDQVAVWTASAKEIEGTSGLTYNGTTLAVTGGITTTTTVAATGNVTGANLSGTNTGDEVTATENTEGIADLATQPEVDAGTAGAHIVIPSTLAAWPGSANITTLGTVTTGTLSSLTITTPTLDLTLGTAPTVNGRIEYHDTNDTILVGDGTGTKVFSDDTIVQARANHTGTQTASTISDFDTEVSNNTDVAANTAKISATTANVDTAGAVMETDFNAQTVLAAVTDNTPTAITVSASTFVGRASTGDVTALTVAQMKTELSVDIKEITLYVVDFSTALTTGNGKLYWRVPIELNGLDLKQVGAQLGNAQSSSGAVTIQIARGSYTGAGGARTWDDMLQDANRLVIDQSEWDSKDATAAVIDTANDDVATGDLIRIDIDTIGTGSQGLFVSLGFG